MRDVSALGAEETELSPEERCILDARAEVDRVTRRLDEVMLAIAGDAAEAQPKLADAEREASSARRECDNLSAVIRGAKDLVRELKLEISRLRGAHERLSAARPGEAFAAMRAEVSRKSAEMRALQSRIGASLLRHVAAERRLEAAMLRVQAIRAEHLRAAAAGDPRIAPLCAELERAEQARDAAEGERGYQER